MRSFRTYADTAGIVDLGAVCSSIVVIPDMPDDAHLAVDAAILAPSAPGTYPLEVVTDGGGEPLRLMGPSAERFASARLVHKLTGAPAGSCWRVVLLDEDENYTHAPGLRAVLPISLVNQETLRTGLPKFLIDGGEIMWPGAPFEQSGFVVPPYAESLRLNIHTTMSVIDPTEVRVWVRTPSFTYAFNHGFTLWDSFTVTGGMTRIYRDLPHGARVVMTLVSNPNEYLLLPRVDATLRLP